jgi:hypothetical protein
MFFRKKQTGEFAAAIATLEVRVYALECAVLSLCDHVEALQQRRPPIARVLESWQAEGRPQ